MIFKRNFTSRVITLFGQVSVFGGFLRRCVILVADFLIQPLVGKADCSP